MSKSVAWFGLAAAVVVAEIVVLIPALSQRVHDFVLPAPGWSAAAIGAQAASWVAFALAQHRMLHAAGQRIRRTTTLRTALAANAVCATLPGGVALAPAYSLRRLRAAGGTSGATAFALTASGITTTCVFAALALITVVTGYASAAAGAAAIATGIFASIGLIVGARWLRSERARPMLNRAQTWARSATRQRSPRRAVASAVGHLTAFADVSPAPRDWAATTIAVALNKGLDILCLGLCLHAVGGPGVGVEGVLLTYVVGMSASALSVLPGGIGTIDVAMIAVLSASLDVPAATAAGAVVTYRLISLVLPVTVGWLDVWRVHHAERVLRHSLRDPEQSPPPRVAQPV